MTETAVAKLEKGPDVPAPDGLPAELEDLERWFVDLLAGLPAGRTAEALARAEALACSVFAPRDVVAVIRRALAVDAAGS
jgi:hypothetical protein